MPAKHSSERPGRAGTMRRIDVVVASALVALGSAGVAALAWTKTATEPLTLAMVQSGSLSYHAPTPANSVYGAPGLHTGQQVYPDIVGSLSVDYTYSAESSAPLHLSGTEQLVATVSDGLGATRTIALQPQTAFAQQTFTTEGTLSMPDLSAAVASLAQSAGARAPGTFQVSLSPDVQVHGLLGGRPEAASFDTPAVFTYIPASPQTPPSLNPPGGTTTGGPTASAPYASSASTTMQVPDARPATLFGSLRVWPTRIGAVAVLAIALLAGTVSGRRLVRDATADDERVRIAVRHGHSLVEVAELPNADQLAVVEMHAFEGLLQVARRLECPVLHLQSDSGVYAVVDNGTLYRYRTARPVTTNGHRPRISTLAEVDGVPVTMGIRVP